MTPIKKPCFGQGVYFHYTKGNVDVYNNKVFHDFYELYFFIEGDVEFIGEKEKRTLVKNDLIIIRPGEYHHMKVKNNVEKYERCVFNIRENFLKDISLLQLLEGKTIINLKESDRIYQNVIYLKNALFSMDKNDLEYLVPHIVTDILFNIKYTKKENDNTTEKISELSSSILKYINDNYKKQLNLKTIADNFYIAESTLSHVFKKDFGISVKKYLIQKRITEAHLLILKGIKPQTVANELSFENYSTFYRAYKNYYKKPPSTYNKKN